MYEDASDTRPGIFYATQPYPRPTNLSYLAAAAQKRKVMPLRNLENGSKEAKVQKQKDNNEKDETAAMDDTYKEQPAS